MAEMQLISIGITCFNAETTIERAVKSALAQDWPNLEIVVVDDCSSDSSWDRLVQIAKTDTRIRVFRHEVNKGYPTALNTIISNAKGEFIAIFDDDDDNVSDRVKSQFQRITEYEKDTNAHLVLCYANRNVVKGGQTKVDHEALAIGRVAPEPSGPEVADYLFGTKSSPGKVWGLFGSCTLMARKSCFTSVGHFDEAFRRCAEWDFAVRASFMEAHFIAVDRPLITMYKTGGADKAGSIPLKYALLLREKHRNYLSKNGLYFASRMIARSNFYGNKKQYVRAYLYRIAAYMTSFDLLKQYLNRRFASGQSIENMNRRTNL